MLDSHFLDILRRSHTPDVLRFSGLLPRVSGQLNSGIVIMKGRQPVLIFLQQRKDESKVVKHARVRPQLWMSGYNLVRQLV